jgi:hypothetical protein
MMIIMDSKRKGKIFWCNECHTFKRFKHHSSDKHDKVFYFIDDEGHFKTIIRW